MPAKRELTMRQLRHLLRLHHEGVSAREIGGRPVRDAKMAPDTQTIYRSRIRTGCHLATSG